jgi:hypothetical protein
MSNASGKFQDTTALFSPLDSPSDTFTFLEVEITVEIRF